MKEFKRDGLRLQVLYFLAVTWFLFPVTGQSADVLAPAQGTVTASAGMQQGTGLTLDEVVRTALENHSSVKSAQYQVGAQDAVLHQQMAAYYPTISFSNTYRTANSGGSSSNASKGFDSFTGAGNASMTLYNFGKREGAVQSARDTLDATQYAYNTTANNIVLAVKQAYYGVLQANALLRVNEETVRDREETLRQTQGFYDVGTKPRSDVTQAQANLYLAQANLILARNGVDVAWANLRNAMGVDDYPRQPLAEELAVTPFSMALAEAKEEAFAARPELLQFAALLKAEDQLIAVARRNHLPDLLFSSIYGRQGVTGESPHNNWQVQLSLNVPIFNGFQTTYQLQQALYTYQSIKEQARVQRQQVALQVEQSYLNLTTAREVVKANEAAVKAAKENLELHEGRYQVGYAPIVEVTDAQTTYTTAQTNYVNALVSYKLAMAQLLNAMGRQ
ncbi:MAG: TolC family protein [Deltaproteobacteria bacterium]|nr:MAG: TolC family protein [Deltaproteobacteria bacterium]